ncbi:alpha/beta hydrolase [Weissella viridescens]|uniref:alpha/beta hydrolase n=1 Tax=Weissella viridescens TaxID=1629 RepID=UPI001747830C|nr:alpha/beta hydrolase [Weissella viridescens]QOD86086.1 alpha/beta hydrolase [Weissella viridescens]
MAERFIDRDYQRTYAEVADIKRKWLDVPYMDGARHTLDIYLPNEERETYPVIIDIFGGGLCFGDKSSHKLEPALRLLRNNGYAVVSMDYSLLADAPFPTQIYEVKAVIRYVRAHATNYQLNPDAIALMGESSGAQLAVTTAATHAVGAMERDDFGEDPDVSEDVQAVIAMYGPYDFDKFVEQFAEAGITSKYPETGTAESFQGQLFGKQAPKDVPELVKKANPVTYFSAKMPPILAMVGRADPVVPYQQTVNMMEAARKAIGKDKTLYYIVEDGVHGPDDYIGATLTQVKADFLEKWLKEQHV